ncbi:unnamed protein product [Notodromas monacha]|uniref:C2HC/C3H-type domain-containing protein n=1 Tax=Notodromas monacha TaxID=399045 RepID=A0A7R9G906_9CRUS|nr:unnamed protein product [Notodromas monacha]CAG0913820.1 unnamed protein product [Notodromas monacha]
MTSANNASSKISPHDDQYNILIEGLLAIARIVAARVPISTEAEKKEDKPQDIFKRGLGRISNFQRSTGIGRTIYVDDMRKNGHENGADMARDKFDDWSTSTGTDSLDNTSHRLRTNERPGTATLNRPAILNISHVNTLDMSTTNSRALLTSGKVSSSFIRTSIVPYEPPSPPPMRLNGQVRANSLPRNRPARPNRRLFRDDSHLASSSESDNYDLRCRTAVKQEATVLPQTTRVIEDSLESRTRTGRGKSKPKRPRTIKLSKPSIDLPIPHITSSSYMGKRYHTSQRPTPIIPAGNGDIPEPCTTCGRLDQPERFHSHPAHSRLGHTHRVLHHHNLQGPVRRTKDHDNNESSHVKTVRSVIKPAAIRYQRKQEFLRQKEKPSYKHKNRDDFICGMSSTPDLEVKLDVNFNNLTIAAEKKTNDKHQKEEISRTEHHYSKPDFTGTLATLNNAKKTDAEPQKIDNKRTSNKRAHQRQKIIPNGSDLDDLADDEKSPEPKPRKLVDSHLLSDSEIANMNPEPAKFSDRCYRCYFCGGKYGSLSLAIHAENCLKRWRRSRDNLPKRLRIPTPEPPPMDDPTRNRDMWNELAIEVFNKQANPECPDCGRRFGVDRIAQHSKSCAKMKRNEPQRPPTPVKRPPPHIPCHICGRLFGTASIDIHIPHCEEKWERENNDLPPHLRRPPPMRPQFVFKDNGDIDYEETQNVFWQSHADQLVPCPKCKRTFYPDRLEKHEPTCRGPR